ncbi:MAG TPA: hypothetical protein PKK10_17930 [Woeseiaceae bacterium]|nr:hypothetical protein [Woeseiaceae bacterium]
MSTKTESISGMADRAAATGSASTTHKAAKAAHELIDGTAAKAEPVEQRLRERAQEAGMKLDESQEAVSRTVEKSVDQVETFIKKRPIAAAGIAFAAGVLATALFRR